MALPASMRYVAVSQPGPPDVMHVASGALPVPRADEVLIAVAYAGVNRPDCAQRAGSYPPPPDASPILGLEVAGRVVALAVFGALTLVATWRVPSHAIFASRDPDQRIP